MHDTIVTTNQGECYVGPLLTWRPAEGWFSILNTQQAEPKKFFFNEVESAVTKDERIGRSKIGDVDELERAHRYLEDARKYQWHPEEQLQPQDWEKRYGQEESGQEN